MAKKPFLGEFEVEIVENKKNTDGNAEIVTPKELWQCVGSEQTSKFIDENYGKFESYGKIQKANADLLKASIISANSGDKEAEKKVSLYSNISKGILKAHYEVLALNTDEIINEMKARIESLIAEFDKKNVEMNELRAENGRMQRELSVLRPKSQVLMAVQ